MVLQAAEHFPHEYKLEPAPNNETRQAELERVARDTAATAAAYTKYNAAYKIWEDRKIGGLSMEDADGKAVSTLYIMLGREGRRQLVQRFPQVHNSGTILIKRSWWNTTLRWNV